MKKRLVAVLSIVVILVSLISACGKSEEKQNKETSDKINNYVDKLTKDKKFSGVVLVAKKGSILTKKAVGMSNYELSAKNDADTKFSIGSMTNEFTAAAILQIEDKGFLSIDDAISKYMPNYPKGDSITINQLLNHTSGIPNFTEFEDYNSVARLNYPLQKIIDSFKYKPLEFVPGSKYKYSDSNYILLGYIIEKVTGKKYFEYIDENILKPLKMKDTGILENEKLIKGRAAGYDIDASGNIKNVLFQEPSKMYSSTGLYSNINDLYLWDRGLYQNKILSKKAQSKFIAIEPGKSNNFCWELDSIAGHKVLFQDNSGKGYSGSIYRFTSDDAVIMVLSNTSMAKEEIDKISSNISIYLFQ